MQLQSRLVALLLAFSLMMWGQANANKAQVSGTVTDAKGALVPNATVKIRNTQTAATRELTTNSEGKYVAVALDPGQYEIVAQSSGFAATTLQGITLNVGSAISVDITLQVQATTTTVQVAETMLNSDLPAPTTVVTTAAIANLPINGRRFQDFATLTPTVTIDPSRGQITFAGQRGINSNIMVDGADYNQPFFGGIRGGERSSSIITLPQSAVQEFQAVTTGYSAEYGRSTGGVLNVISKSGTNNWHGDAFYQNRNAELSKNSPIPVPDQNNPTGPLVSARPTETLQQWGGSVGGPIKRDKLFAFVAYEQQHATQPRRTVFASLIGYTPTATQQSVFNYYKSLEQPFNKVGNAGAGTLKGDYLFHNGSRLSLRYNRSGSEEVNAVSVGGVAEPFTNGAISNEGIEKDKVHFGTAQLTSLFGPTLVNDLRFSGSYEQRPRLSNSTAPGLSVSAIGFAGARNFLPTVQDDSRYQITDSLSKIYGNHTFKVGADIDKLHAFQTFGFDQFGTFTVSGSNISTLLDILSGAGTINGRFNSSAASYSRQIGNTLADYPTTQAAVFAQDSWRATRKLTVDLGVRWEGQWNPTPEANNTSLVNTVNSFAYPNGAKLDVTKIPNATKQFMPRVGFAYSPFSSGRLVIRAHGGIFYAASPMLLFSDAVGNFRTPPNNVRLFLNNATNGTIYQQFNAAGLNLNTVSLDALPIIPLATVQTAAAFGLGTTPDPYRGAGTTAVALDFQNPRSYQMGYGAEGRISSSWTAGGQFYYVKAVHLERNRDYNLPVPAVRDASLRPIFAVASVTPATPRPISSLGQINIRESSAKSLYRGFTFNTQYRSGKLTAGANYTLAWNYSDDDNERDSGGQQAMDSFNYKQDYSYTNIDSRHQFASYAVYRVPFGIDVSGIFRVSSGRPMNPRTGADTNGDTNANADRPYSAPGVPFARNSFRNRTVYNDDLRILKSFNLGSENRRVQISAEFFNIFNIDNVVFGGTTNIYGLGINSSGQPVAVDSRFQLLKTADGKYSTQNSQYGLPFQAQFGARFFF